MELDRVVSDDANRSNKAKVHDSLINFELRLCEQRDQ